MSAMTIRRDIAELADKGLLKRVHGGAVTTSTLLSEPLFSVKSQMDIGLKDAIARLVREKDPSYRCVITVETSFAAVPRTGETVQ